MIVASLGAIFHGERGPAMLRQANEDATCRSYGAQPGSPGSIQCRMNLSNQRAQVDANDRAIAMQYFAEQPPIGLSCGVKSSFDLADSLGTATLWHSRPDTRKQPTDRQAIGPCRTMCFHSLGTLRAFRRNAELNSRISS